MIVNVGTTGFNSDVAPALLPPDAISGGNNFLCTEGSVRAPSVREKVYTLSVEPKFHYVWTTIDDEDKVVISDGDKVLLYDADGTEHDLNSANRFTTDCSVTFTDLNTVLVVNSDLDGPFYYDPATDKLKALTGWPTTWKCKVMASVRYNLVAVNMIEDGDPFPQKVRWSNSAADGDLPTQWTPAASNDAGDDLIGESGAHANSAVLMRDALWIGKTDSIYQMSYIGGQYIYSLIRRTGDAGPSGVRAMTACKNQIALLNLTDLYLFDGSSMKSLSDNKVGKALLALSDGGEFSYAELIYSPNQDFLLVTGVGTGRVTDTSLVYSFKDSTWSVLTFGGLYGFDLTRLTVDVGRELICYRKQGDDYQVERFVIAYDPAKEVDYLYATGIAERTGISLGEGAMMVEKVLPMLRGRIRQTADGDTVHQSLKLQIGVQRSQDGPVSWTPLYEIDPPEKRFVPVRKVGRYLCWRIETLARVPWFLDGLDVRGFPAGDKD